MPSAEITVINTGFATFQDLGRYGHEKIGISVNGAADQLSAMTANMLVGNSRSHPLVEVTGSSLSFMPNRPILLAVTGAPASVTVNNSVTPQWSPTYVPAKSFVQISHPHEGFRTYVAFGGKLRAEKLLGSCAPDPLLGLTQRIATGDALTLEQPRVIDHPYSRIPVFRFPIPYKNAVLTKIVPLLHGPDLVKFDQAEGELQAHSYRVSNKTNHIGIRLAGTLPRRLDDDEILSRGMTVGAVEITPHDELILLGRGRTVTAGYPVVAVIPRYAMSAMGQFAPGQEVHFKFVGLGEAQARYVSQLSALEILESRIAVAFENCCVKHDLNPSIPHNSATEARMDPLIS